MSPARTPNRNRRIETDDDEPLVPPAQSAADPNTISSQADEGSRSNPVACDSNTPSSDDDDNGIEEPGLSVVLQSPKASSTIHPLHHASPSAAVSSTVASQQGHDTPKRDSTRLKKNTSKSSSKLPSSKSQRLLNKSRKRTRHAAEASESDASTDSRSCALPG
jgi:hypothetical protein